MRAQLSPLFQPAVLSQGSIFHCSAMAIHFVSWPLFQLVQYFVLISVWFEVGAACSKSTGWTNDCLMFCCSIQFFRNTTLETQELLL